MKKLLFIVVLMMFVAGFSQSADQLFSDANNFYKEGKYQEAIDLYEEIETLNVYSDELYYNLGNCYYKLNMVAPSIYNYEKALKIDPTNEDAILNLQFANKMALDAVEVLPKSIFQKLEEGIIFKLTYEYWAYLAVICSFLGALLFLMYHFSYTSNKKLLFFNTTILATLLMIISVIFAFKAYDFEVHTHMGIIFEKSTEIKNAPTFNSDTVFQLHEGTKVEVLDAIDDWKKIKLADGKIGWIVGENLKEI